MPAVTPSRRRRTQRWLKKIVFALLTTCGFFLLFEFTLGLCGIRPVTDTHDPFAGFSQIPLLESTVAANGEQLLTTAPSKLVWFNSQTFPKQKPVGTRRIFCVGGSTTYGRPYWDATSYSGWLRELLPLADGTCDWEVINAGGVSYASYRVAAVMEELAQYEPDLFIVYSVHNEFLERRTYDGMFQQSFARRKVSGALSRTRTWALLDRVIVGQQPLDEARVADLPPEEVHEILNDTVGPSDYHRDPSWRADVLRHYEMNIERMVTIAAEAGAAIVFVTPAANEKDCSPFKSEESSRLSAEERKRLFGYLETTKEQLAAQQYDDALVSIEQARKLDGRHAEVQYLHGKALFALGREELASQSFTRALNEDVCPLRALPEITEAIRRVAKRERTPLVDFGFLLHELCRREYGHGCLGEEFFLDHVHPTTDVHRQLALWIIEELQEEGLVRGSAVSAEAINLVTNQIESRIDREAQGIALRNLAKVLHWAGKFDEAAPRAADALVLLENDFESQFLLAECLRLTGRNDQAMIEFDKLFVIAPNYDRGYIPFGILLVEEGHLDAAKFYLAMGVTLFPNRDDAHQALGAAHLQLGEYEFAVQSLQEANALNPNNLHTLFLLARTQVAMSDFAAAVSLYNEVLALDSNDADAHNELGEALLQLGRSEAASAHFLSALTIDPDHEDARFNLDAIRKDLGL